VNGWLVGHGEFFSVGNSGVAVENCMSLPYLHNFRIEQVPSSKAWMCLIDNTTTVFNRANDFDLLKKEQVLPS